MKVNIFQAARIGLDLLEALEAAKGKRLTAKDDVAAIYVGARELAAKLERENGDISDRCGYAVSITEVEYVAGINQAWNATAPAGLK